MATITGGRRLRLVQDNFRNHLTVRLGNLGWFDADRQHLPIRMVTDPVENDVEIKPNMIAISGEAITDYELELGSTLSENRWEYYIDIFAQSHALGVDLSGDIRDVLRGKMASAGATIPFFDVLDLSLTTPVKIFHCEIENVQVARQRVASKPFQRFWWTVGVEIVDIYDNEGD